MALISAQLLGGRLGTSTRLRSTVVALLVFLLTLSAVLNVFVYLTYVTTVFGHNDFRLYYAGAEVGLQYGWSHIYDAKLHQAAVAALQPVGPWYALLTPAPITWLVAPLTLVGYPAAFWVWLAFSLAILGVAVWWARPRHLSFGLYLVWWAALGPLWFSAYEGQVTILAAAGLLAGWRLLETRRDFLAGMVLAAALFKPYLVVLLPIALLVSGRWRALLGFSAVGVAAGIGMFVTLHPDGIRAYLDMLLAPQAAGNTAKSLGSALGGGPAVLAIEAASALAVAAVALYARRSGTAWPIVVSSLLGSFLLATYWHPQDYLALDVAAAIMLAAAPIRQSLPTAAAIALTSALVSPLSSRQVTLAWLLLAMVLLGVLGARTVVARRWERRTLAVAS